MPSDPFAIKKRAKFHPTRVFFTAVARIQERAAQRHFANNILPLRPLSNLPDEPVCDWAETAVTPYQMRHILAGLRDTEGLGGAIVEIGSCRGITAKAMFESGTLRDIYAVDPFIGYGGYDVDYRRFQQNVLGTSVRHLRATSGEARRTWGTEPVSFLFIDAVHDYVNTAFDISAWETLLVSGGILALHDTDLEQFAGTRRAAREAADRFELYAHIHNLVMFRRGLTKEGLR